MERLPVASSELQGCDLKHFFKVYVLGRTLRQFTATSTRTQHSPGLLDRFPRSDETDLGSGLAAVPLD